MIHLEVKNKRPLLRCVRRPLTWGDQVLLWSIVAVMGFMGLYTGISWYALLGVPVVVSLVWVYRPQNPVFKITHTFLLGLFWFVSMVGFGQWVKYYILEFYTVPTNSMEQTILPGDRVLVCKMVYGARQFTKQGSERLWGFDGVRRGDIVVFNAPGTTESKDIRECTPYIKRCVALPGDMFEIRESVVWVNGVMQEAPQKAMFRYRFFFRDSLAMQKAGKELTNNQLGTPANIFPSRSMLETYLTQQEANALATHPGCTEFRLSYSVKPNAAVYPHQDSLLWNLNRWGPMWIPRRGDSIELTEENALLYGSIIKQHEGHRVSIVGGVGYVDEQPKHYYVFSKNYYFMMGDHRMESQDSRILGPIPEDHLIGKAVRIAWSLSPGINSELASSNNNAQEPSHHFRWNRIFKKI